MGSFGVDSRVPVVMYHAVGDPAPGWIWPQLAISEDLFARQLAALAERGWRGATLSEVRAWQERGKGPDDRRVVLTFDDGYLGVWTLAAPLLRRYGLRGLVYVNNDFVEPGGVPRPTLDDVAAGRARREDVAAHGFLNRAELAALAAEGVIEVGSHSRTHTWYESGPRVVGFHGEGETPPWPAWNARPDRKHAYLVEDQTGYVPLGFPIHENGRSLGVRRFFPDPAIAAATVAHVAACGGAGFFAGADRSEELQRIAAEADGGRGRYETDEERDTRFRDEIVAARDELAALADAPIRHFAWPGGAYDDASWGIAEAAGFETIVVKAADRARWRRADPRLVRRVSCMERVSFRGRRIAVDDPAFLVDACMIERGSRGALWSLRGRKLLAAWRS